jgi:hypothetical protein
MQEMPSPLCGLPLTEGHKQIITPLCKHVILFRDAGQSRIESRTPYTDICLKHGFQVQVVPV